MIYSKSRVYNSRKLELLAWFWQLIVALMLIMWNQTSKWEPYFTANLYFIHIRQNNIYYIYGSYVKYYTKTFPSAVVMDIVLREYEATWYSALTNKTFPGMGDEQFSDIQNMTIDGFLNWEHWLICFIKMKCDKDIKKDIRAHLICFSAIPDIYHSPGWETEAFLLPHWCTDSKNNTNTNFQYKITEWFKITKE